MKKKIIAGNENKLAAASLFFVYPTSGSIVEQNDLKQKSNKKNGVNKDEKLAKNVKD